MWREEGGVGKIKRLVAKSPRKAEGKQLPEKKWEWKNKFNSTLVKNGTLQVSQGKHFSWNVMESNTMN